MIDLLHRLLGWLAYQLAPKSPAFDRDERVAATILSPSERRTVRRGTAKKSPGAVRAARGVTEERTLDEHTV